MMTKRMEAFMQGKFIFGGEGVKVPGTEFGLSFALFKVWLCPTGGQFAGYTTASNQGLLGYAIIETPVVDFVMRDLEDEERFMNLHGATVDVTISPTIFFKDGGLATIKMLLRSNNAGASPKELSFFSDECRGFAASIGDIHFTATLLQLPTEEQDPRGVSYVPW
jgi:hypothetical protein